MAGRSAGFTIIEVLLITTVLGVIAVALLPLLTEPPPQLGAAELQREWQRFRHALDKYAEDHQGEYPQLNTGGELERALLSASVVRTSAHGKPTTSTCGPYLVGRLPHNPYAEQQGVCVVDDLSQVPETSRTDAAWYYEPRTGRIAPNLPADARLRLAAEPSQLRQTY